MHSIHNFRSNFPRFYFNIEINSFKRLIQIELCKLHQFFYCRANYVNHNVFENGLIFNIFDIGETASKKATT